MQHQQSTYIFRQMWEKIWTNSPTFFLKAMSQVCLVSSPKLFFKKRSITSLLVAKLASPSSKTDRNSQRPASKPWSGLFTRRNLLLVNLVCLPSNFSRPPSNFLLSIWLPSNVLWPPSNSTTHTAEKSCLCLTITPLSGKSITNTKLSCLKIESARQCPDAGHEEQLRFNEVHTVAPSSMRGEPDWSL